MSQPHQSSDQNNMNANEGQGGAQGYANPQMVTGQPGIPSGAPVQVQFMPRPVGIPGVPPGLEYLTQIDQLLVHQQVQILEVLTGYEMQNKYEIKNSLGQQVYFATEESGCCNRYFCGPQRGFVMHITDNLGQEVIRVNRHFKCCAGCCWCANSLCCAMEIEVESPVGQVCGYARQLQSGWRPRYSILDAGQQEVLYIEGPKCICQGICCTADQDFKVYSSDRSQQIGKLSKQWSGFVQEEFTNAQNFNAKFPMDLDVHIKAVLIGTIFLIDFMYFEHKKRDNNY